MSTTTLLVVIGFGVLVKTAAFVGLLVRRGRRQRRAVAAAVAARTVAERGAAPAAASVPSPWRLQWAEPGVLLVENADELGSARGVELCATLTTGGGRTASLVRHERFVGTGASFLARFVELEEWLAQAVLVDPGELRLHLASRLDLSLTWTAADGTLRTETQLDQAVVPVPDLALEPA